MKTRSGVRLRVAIAFIGSLVRGEWARGPYLRGSMGETGIPGNGRSVGTRAVSVHPVGGWESTGLQAGMMVRDSV